jgi:hypothetical protein
MFASEFEVKKVGEGSKVLATFRSGKKISQCLRLKFRRAEQRGATLIGPWDRWSASNCWEVDVRHSFSYLLVTPLASLLPAVSAQAKGAEIMPPSREAMVHRGDEDGKLQLCYS